MIKNRYHESLILKRNVDKDGNPIGIKILDHKQVMDSHNCIVLSQLPDETYGIDIDGYTEVFDSEHIGVKNYKVDYVNGIIYFNPINIGANITVGYQGIGCELIYASRVATRLDNSGNVVETLEEILDKGRESLKLLETLGDATTVVLKLEGNITKADEKISEMSAVTESFVSNMNNAITQADNKKTQIIGELNDAITNVQDDIDTIKATGNTEIIIQGNEWILNSDIYEKEITHDLYSENLHITAKDLTTKSACTIGWQILDKSRILLKSDSAISMSLTLSASYYKATQTISDDIASEVLKSRQGQASLDSNMARKINYENFTGTTIN